MKGLNSTKALGTLNRRGFTLGLSAAALFTNALSGATGARASTPKRGGRFRAGINSGSTTDTLDPATSNSNIMFMTGYALRNNLTEVNNRNELVPELAESWESSKDATKWTFKLRKGVLFHNGKQLDANDVISSINHHRGPNSKSAAKSLLESITDIKKDGNDIVVISLQSGNADLPYIFYDFHLGIMAASSEGTVDWSSGIGTGGYSLDKFEPGVQISFKKHPNYWKTGHAHFDEVELLAITDTTARTTALQTGSIDVMEQCDIKTLSLLLQDTSIDIEEVEGRAHVVLPMRTDTAPLNDNNVRLALKHGIDRETLIKTVFSGHGTVGNDHPINRSYRYFASELPQRVYDPDKARFYLKQAGLTELRIDLSTSDAPFPGAVDSAILYKEQASKAGININVITQPSDGYWDNIWMKVPWCVSYWAGRATEDLMFSVGYEKGAAWNDTFWENDQFNTLLNAARAELDETKRREMYVEMQEILSNEGGALIPVFSNFISGKRKNLQHGPVSSIFDLDGWKATERWWFD
jgi:peptide/nickel transport system substrate-binding protein